MRLVGSVSAAHWRRVSCAVASVSAMAVALVCMASQATARRRCRAAAAGSIAVRAAWSARVAFSCALRTWRRARRRSSATYGGAQVSSRW